MSIQESIRIVPKGDIALVEFDLIGEKVNKLSSPIMARLDEVIEELKRGTFGAAIFISRKPKIWVAGADIEEIKSIRKREDALKAVMRGHEILNKIEDLKIPVVAAINGACLGGGCELALACDYRIATDDPSTRIGLPETKLGVLPGFGGCIRLPRVIGVRAALDIILAGKSVDGKKAEKLGLVDRCVPALQLEEWALKTAREAIDKGGRKRKKYFQARGLAAKFLESAAGRPIVFSQARKMLLKQTGGNYPAPERALEIVRKTAGMGNREKAQKIEANGFADVAVTDVSKNLIHIFFLTEGIKKQTGVSDPAVKPRKVNAIGVLGAGTMGGGIAQLAADKGIEVRVKDINNEALAKAFQTANEIWEKEIKKRRLSNYDYKRKLAKISGGTTFDGFQHLDLIIEAIVEDMDIKKKVIGETANHAAPATIIATNTSSLSVTEMSKGHPNPANFGGMHFFNPVNKMPLVEVIRGDQTAPEVTATIFDLAKKLGKFPVVVKDGPGFLVNRLLLPYLNEAAYMLGEGISVEDIDKAFLKFGMPMGPCHLIDEIGIDVGAKVAKIFHKAFGERAKPSPFMQGLVESGRLGKKNKKGFYLYDSKGKKLSVDPSVYQAMGLPKPSAKLPADEIVKRGIYAMVNEAALALLEDRIVETAQDVDLAMIMGTGFPPFRGGLLKYADSVGTSHIVDDLEIFATKVGERFKPSQPLKNMAKTQRTFYATTGNGKADD
ncbi:MAG: 3-hydroxyacyl-CoA dehydrogenase NAD-binding domain-containing protein [Bdellovibrionia bacterium]